MNYQQARISDLFDIKKLGHKAVQKGNSHIEDFSEDVPSAFFAIQNKRITITCAAQLSIGLYDGNNLTMQKSYFLEESAKNKGADIKYVYYFLLANKERLDKLYVSLDGAAFIRVLTNFMIYYPSIPIQYEIVGKLDSIFNLIRICENSLKAIEQLPYMFYRKNEQMSESLWKTIKLSDLTQQISIKKGKKQISEKIKHSEYSIILGGKCNLILENISPNYNVEFLRYIISGKSFAKQLEVTGKLNKISLYKIRRTKINLPSNKEQKFMLQIFHKANDIHDCLNEYACSLHSLKAYCLHYYLYRKTFGLHVNESLDGDFLKCSYLKPMMIDSINRYDELRQELYDSLSNGAAIQYFDTSTKSIKIRRK